MVSTFGGSGVLATELGIRSRKGHEIHFITYIINQIRTIW